MKKLLLLCLPLFAQQYDLVIANGRVIDPASHTDAIRNLGINGRSIAAISEKALNGKSVLDAKGLVVAPGFIDMHSHGQDAENYRYKAMDGVTTALEMEVGVTPVASWYAERKGKALVNYGATVGHIPIRMKVFGDQGDLLPRDRGAREKGTSADQAEIRKRIRQGLAEGALGIGFGINYVPAASRREILEIFQIAAEKKVACYVHVRFSGPLEPGSVTEAVEEILAAAAVTGASVQMVHVTSSSLRETPHVLAMLDGARKRGLDVTVEAYPYTAAMTALESAIFDDGWQERMSISFKDLQWVETGERLTAETFAKYRKQGGEVVIHSIPEDAVRAALAHPGVMIASDGLLRQGKGHPRAAGTYARVLGRYVREQKVLSLPDAIARMSLLPAQRLESISPAMKKKGRIQVGADADLAIFDPATVIDKATFDKPAQYSAGFRHVLVNGIPVVRDGKLVEGRNPGEGIVAAGR